MLNALIFDVDGTLADTESVHLEAFNHAFQQEGLDWHWSTEQYTQLLDISGGKERMLAYWRSVDPDLKEVEAGAVSDTSASPRSSRARDSVVRYLIAQSPSQLHHLRRTAAVPSHPRRSP